MPYTLPESKVCGQHKNYFPDEDSVRPLAEYRIDKGGKIHPVWCKRCTSKKMHEYQLRKKESGETTPKQPFEMKVFLDALRDEVNSLAAQIEIGDDAEIARLSEAFSQASERAVAPVLHYYAAQRAELPSQVYDQRIDPQSVETAVADEQKKGASRGRQHRR